jgi:hypothetical protein
MSGSLPDDAYLSFLVRRLGRVRTPLLLLTLGFERRIEAVLCQRRINSPLVVTVPVHTYK